MLGQFWCVQLWLGRTWRWLVVLAALLAVLSPLLRFGAAALRRLGLTVSGAVPTLFDMNTEANVPSSFAVLLWALFGAVATVLAVLDRRRRLGMSSLAVIAVLLGVDEAVSLHERLGGLGANVAWAPRFAWVLPGVVIGVVLVAVPARTVLSLPRRACTLVLVGGVVFVLGALVAEVISGEVLVAAGDGALYAVVTTIEESCEMAGVLLALAGLLTLLDGPLGHPRLSGGARAASGRPSASDPSGSAAPAPSP